MIKHSFLTGLLLIIVTIAVACSEAPMPEQAVVTTPVADLPVSASSSFSIDLPTPVPDVVIKSADAEYMLMTNLYERLSPSVVNINTRTEIPNHEGLLQVNSGSGFVFDKVGHIVTNSHVVKDAVDLTITFNNGYVTDAEIVGVDNYSDLAVLRVNVEPDRLVPIELSDSNFARVGQRAIAIGNPFGLSSSMTSGIISAVGRQLSSSELIGGEEAPGFQNPSIIQVDADINPGNSGGPLLNSEGRLIGVNTAIRSNSGAFEGIGFAVPSNTVARVVPEIIEKGEVNYPWLGISARSDEDGFGVAGVAEALGLPVTSGIMITSVSEDSPAQIAGLRGGQRFTMVRDQELCVGGDIIIAINDVYVDSIDELLAYLVMYVKPDDMVTLRVVRGEETFDIDVTLQERPLTSNAPLCG